MNNDCLLCVIGFLGLDDVMKCSLVNKQFNVVMRSEMIWIQLFREHFWNVPCTKNFYDNFKECFKFDNFLKERGNKNVYLTHHKNWNINNVIMWTEINLHIKIISILPRAIGHFVLLKSLRLSCNLLSTLPIEMRQLNLLEDLFLDANDFVTFPEIICELNSLKMLDICNNKLNILSEKISNLSSLQELYLGYNKLQTIPNSINQLTNLQLLSIHHNNLEKLPMVDNLVNLKTLRIDKLQKPLMVNVKQHIIDMQP